MPVSSSGFVPTWTKPIRFRHDSLFFPGGSTSSDDCFELLSLSSSVEGTPPALKATLPTVETSKLGDAELGWCCPCTLFNCVLTYAQIIEMFVCRCSSSFMPIYSPEVSIFPTRDASHKKKAVNGWILVFIWSELPHVQGTVYAEFSFNAGDTPKRMPAEHTGQKIYIQAMSGTPMGNKSMNTTVMNLTV